MTRVCSRCDVRKDVAEFNRRSAVKSGLSAYCRECAQKTALEFYASTRERQRELRARRKYKLTDEQIQRWKTQRACDICGEASATHLCIDHDHASGKFRGLLCFVCNTGRRPDDIDFLKARIAYLEKHRDTRVDISSVSATWMRAA